MQHQSIKEQASAKDPGKWWKNTTVDPTEHFISRIYLMKPTFEERVNSLTDDNYSRHKSHLKWADGYSGDELKLMKQRFFLAMGEEWRAKYDAAYVNYLAFGKGNPNGADGHSMYKERVNGVVANMDGWYEALDIKEGALYRKPADRIRIW